MIRETVSAGTRILHVGGDGGVADSLAGGDAEPSVTTVGDADAAVERLGADEFDVIVLELAAVAEPSAVVERLARAAPVVPRLAVTDDPERRRAVLEAGATDCAPTDQPRVLQRRISNAVVRVQAQRTDGSDDRAKIRALHDVATRLEDCETEERIYEVAVEAAENILEFDMCYFGLVEGDEIRPQTANSDLLVEPVIMTVDEGVVGRTYHDGESYIVTDRGDPDAAPVDDSIRSAVSIPVGEDGVFQAVATEYAAFDEADRELGELLAAHVAAAVERVRYEAALRRERDEFAALFERIPDAVVRYERNGERADVSEVNPAFERIFGYDSEEAVGRRLTELIVPEDRVEEARRLETKALAGELIDREVERSTADGTRPFLMRIAPLATGEDAAGFVIYTDVSDIVKRENELQRQNARLQQFASIVSHDLRNPMNVAQGHLEAAREHCDTEHVDEAMTSIDRMNHLVDDLLELARQGQVLSDPEPVGLDDVAGRAWETVRTGSGSLRLGDLPTVEADASRLQQLFENLFRNAVEHAGHDVTVEVGGLDDGFYVEDDGPGIPTDHRQVVFDSGYSTSDSGTGLGLAIVEQIAEAHGWSVRAAEGESGGARFEFVAEGSLDGE